MLDALKSLTTQLSAARSATDIGTALYTTAGRFGFTTGLGLDVTKLFDELGDSVIFAGHRDAVEVLNAEFPLSQHPLVKAARTAQQPFVMSDCRKQLGVSETDWWRMFPPYFQGYDGIVVPVHDRGQLAWYVAFAGAHPDLSPKVVAVMSCAAHAGYDRFKELISRKTDDSPLTGREAECLQLVAQGKTDADIGSILHISARTVRFHVSNAKAKLGVTTRIQAVAKQLGAA